MNAPVAAIVEKVNEWTPSPDVNPLACAEGSLAETILCVEDEAFVRTVTCEVLRSAGYRVLAARNAAEAVPAYERNGGTVDLLLTDIILPGETGRALATKLRREDPGLRVLFVTGYAEQMDFKESENEQCLAKPFSTDALLRRVRRLLDGRGG